MSDHTKNLVQVIQCMLDTRQKLMRTLDVEPTTRTQRKTIRQLLSATDAVLVAAITAREASMSYLLPPHKWLELVQDFFTLP